MKALSFIPIELGWTLTIRKPTLGAEFVGVLPVSFAAVENAVRDANYSLLRVSRFKKAWNNSPINMLTHIPRDVIA